MSIYFFWWALQFWFGCDKCLPLRSWSSGINWCAVVLRLWKLTFLLHKNPYTVTFRSIGITRLHGSFIPVQLCTCKHSNLDCKLVYVTLLRMGLCKTWTLDCTGLDWPKQLYTDSKCHQGYNSWSPKVNCLYTAVLVSPESRFSGCGLNLGWNQIKGTAGAVSWQVVQPLSHRSASCESAGLQLGHFINEYLEQQRCRV